MKLKIVFFIVIISLLSSCGDYKTEKGYVNKKTVDEYLYRLTKGYTYHNQAVNKKVKLDELEEYIIARKDKIYTDENEFLLHLGLIKLYRSEFVKAFKSLREYTEITGDITRTYYNIAKVIRHQDYRSADIILGLAVLSTRDTFPAPLDVDQQVSAVNASMKYPTLIMAPYVLGNEEMLNHYNFDFDLNEKVERLESNKLDTKMINKKLSLYYTTETQVQEILDSNLTTTTLKLDYAVAYYIHPYREDFQGAAFYADKRDYREWILPYPSFRIPDLMRAYIGAGKYEKALEIYEYHKDKYDTMGESLTYINLLAAAAYAGLNEFETSFKYLSREFAITEIRKNPAYIPSSARVRFNYKGDMLRSLFEVYFFFDEFRNFENTPWQQKFEDMVNRNIKRYSDLPLFNR